jgi:uncharacterized protein
MPFIEPDHRDTRIRLTDGADSGRLQTRAIVLGAALMLTMAWAGGGCNLGQQPNLRNDLDAMPTVNIQINGHTFHVWLATTDTERERGLMQVPDEKLAPLPPDPDDGLPDGAERGMLFVFENDRLLGFWMYNTIIPLDIAYLRHDGTIITTYTMAPLETRTYPSIEPARFALEVRAGLFQELGIGPGDHVEIPKAVLKSTP